MESDRILDEGACFHLGIPFGFWDEIPGPAAGCEARPHPSEDGEALQKSARRMVGNGPGLAPQVQTDARFLPNWFAVYTTSRHEKRVAEHFSHREIEHYLPLYRSERKWKDGSRVTLDLPLFPGYIFVHIAKTERVRVLSVPGALAVVGGTGREPAPLPDAAIQALRCGLKLREAEPHTFADRGGAGAHPNRSLCGDGRHRGEEEERLSRGVDAGADYAQHRGGSG